MLPVESQTTEFLHAPMEVLRTLESFYSESAMRQLFNRGHVSLLYPGLTRSFFPERDIRQIPTENLSPLYWDLHTQAYVERISDLTAHISQRHPDIPPFVAVIPSRNERHTSQAIHALKTSYGQSFDRDVLVLIYHNFASPPEQEVFDDLDTCQRMSPRCHVVHERVLPSRTLAEISKVAFDMAYAVAPDSTFIRIDADVEAITPGAIQRGIEALNRKNIFAVSANYSLETEALKNQFPVFAFIEGIRSDMDRMNSLLSHVKKSPIYTFSMLVAKTYAALGGQPVIRKLSNATLRQVVYDDMEMRDVMFSLWQQWHKGKAKEYPVANTSAEDLVFVGASREVESLLGGCPSHYRWKNESVEFSIAQQPRIDIQSIHRTDTIPELGDPTATNVVAALSALWDRILERYLFSFSWPTDEARFFLQAIVGRGYTITYESYEDDMKTHVTIAPGVFPKYPPPLVRIVSLQGPGII